MTPYRSDAFVAHATTYGTDCVLESAVGLLAAADVCVLAKRVNALIEPKRRRDGSGDPRWRPISLPTELVRQAIIEQPGERPNVLAGKFGVSVATVRRVRREHHEQVANLPETGASARMDKGLARAKTRNPTTDLGTADLHARGFVHGGPGLLPPIEELDDAA